MSDHPYTHEVYVDLYLEGVAEEMHKMASLGVALHAIQDVISWYEEPVQGESTQEAPRELKRAEHLLLKVLGNGAASYSLEALALLQQRDLDEIDMDDASPLAQVIKEMCQPKDWLYILRKRGSEAGYKKTVPG